MKTFIDILRKRQNSKDCAIHVLSDLRRWAGITRSLSPIPSYYYATLITPKGGISIQQNWDDLK